MFQVLLCPCGYTWVAVKTSVVNKDFAFKVKAKDLALKAKTKDLTLKAKDLAFKAKTKAKDFKTVLKDSSRTRPRTNNTYWNSVVFVKKSIHCIILNRTCVTVLFIDLWFEY